MNSIAFKYILSAVGWKLNENIDLVFMTHYDKIPPASILAFIAFPLEPSIINLLIILEATMKGTKQKFSKVNLYS
jgi:hypothetical protein